MALFAGEAALMVARLPEKYQELVKFVDDEDNWPGEVGMKFTAPRKTKACPNPHVGKWPSATMHYREHVSRLLVDLADALDKIHQLESEKAIHEEAHKKGIEQALIAREAYGIGERRS